VTFFTQFCYKFIQVTACKKIDILHLSLIKLLQKQHAEAAQTSRWFSARNELPVLYLSHDDVRDRAKAM